MLVTIKPTRGTQLTLVVLDLGDDPSGRRPALRLMAELLYRTKGLLEDCVITHYPNPQNTRTIMSDGRSGKTRSRC